MKNEQRDIPTLVKQCKELKERVKFLENENSNLKTNAIEDAHEIARLEVINRQIKSDFYELKHKYDEQKNLHQKELQNK